VLGQLDVSEPARGDGRGDYSDAPTQGDQKSVAGGQSDQDVSALSASSAEFADLSVSVPAFS
jgi:hypothetical protein